MAKRRKDFFDGKSCVRCGTKENLELDHRISSDKISHAIWSWREDKRQKELDKCQVLCNTCHKAKTNIFDREHAKHGGYSMYWEYDCRCDLCLEWKLKEDKRKR